MKWLTTFCLIHALCTLSAQTYLTSTATWTESSANCFYGECNIYSFTHTLSGDTVINGLVYYRVVTAGTHSVYDLDLGEIVLVEPYILDPEFIREEDNQFLWYRDNINDDIVLADFDLAVGDIAVNRGCQSELIVDHVDTVYLDQEPRRRYWFGPGNFHHNYLIEGVGATGGLFTSPCSEIGIESGSSMECFSQDDGLIVIDTSAACNTTTSVSQLPDFNVDFTVIPNPASDHINIVFNKQDVSGIMIVRLFNLHGHIMLTHECIDRDEVRIDVAGFVPGVYFLVVQMGNAVDVVRVSKV